MAPRGGDRGGPAVAASPAPVSVRELCERSAKRTHSMFETASTSDRPPTHEPSVRLKMAVKIRDDFDAVRRGARGVVGVVAHGAMPQNAAMPSAATPSAATPSEGASESFIPGLEAAASAKSMKELTLSPKNKWP